MTATIHVCGHLRIDWDGERLEEALTGPQIKLLFAYLTLHRDRPVRRDELLEVLWGDGSPADGDALLRPLLSRLRRALGRDRLEGRSALAVSFPDDVWIDFEAVREGLKRARHALAGEDYAGALEQASAAVAIADAGLLPGLEAGWLEPLRAELEDLLADGLEVVAIAGAGGGPAELAEAESAARRAVELSPYRESARAALIEVLRRRGNTAEALVAYDEIRTLLRDELGSTPGPELRALHQALLGSETVDAALPPDVDGTPALPERLVQAAATAWVGRDEALATLRAAADRAAAGGPEVVLVAGHGGIGKTRLAAELALSLSQFDVLYGRCEDGQLFPYGPWLELLNRRLSAMPDGDVAELLGAMAPSVAQLIPELRERLGQRVPEPVHFDPETERRQLFMAVTRVVARLAAKRPVLLILDDLHWADRSSLLLARHVAGEPQLGRVLLLGTVRDTELEPGHELPELLADLERHRAVSRIALTGMPDAEVAALIGSLHDDAVPDATVRAIRAETDGNPFFVKQLVRHLQEVRGELSLDDELGVPEGVRDVIARRISRLPPGADEVLPVAALIGRDFGFELLADVAGCDEDALLDMLDAAVRGALLVEVAPGRYAFAHALVRGTLDAQLSQTRRAVTHRRIAAAIEARYGERLESWLAELARHFGAAGPEMAQTAIDYAERAAEQATRRLAFDEAAELMQQAVALFSSAVDADPAERARLELSLATTEAAAGHRERARTTFGRVAAVARTIADAETFARAALGHAEATWDQYGREDAASARLLEEALARLPDTDSSLRVRVLARLAETLYYSSEPDERIIEPAFESVEMARRLNDDPGALGAALTAAQYACWGPGRAAERLTLANELVAVADAHADPVRAAEAHAWCVIALLELCRIDEADVHIERHAALAERAQQQQSLIHRDALRALRALLAGDFPAGAAAAKEALEWARRAAAHGGPPGANDRVFYAAEMVQILNERGELGQTVAAIEHAASELDLVPGWRATLAWANVQAGRPDAARAEIADLVADGCAIFPRNAGFVPSLALLAHAVEELGDRDLAAPIEPLLVPHRDTWVVMGNGIATLGPVAYSLGVLQLALGRIDDAIATLELALDRANAMRARPYIARSQAALARALRARDAAGDPERAAELAAQARATARELGMLRLEREVAAG